MNTRLQVEHPVSEIITGLDLVEQQIRIAANQLLEYKQQQISMQGHAIECRINAEDPKNDFQPQPGKITKLKLPSSSDSVRLDTHIEEGYEVPPFYDSMIGKLIVRGETRKEAIAKTKQALQEITIEGIPTTIPTLLKVLSHKSFQDGSYSTKIMENIAV
jgi:acetyl-CoA carboxylase biotin carboxylase subunit